MGLHLRLRRRNKDGSAGEFTTRIDLDTDFYTLTDLINYLDDAIYNNFGATFLTKDQDAFDLSPNQYNAIAVIED